MDFVQSKFGTNEPLPVELFFPHFLAGFRYINVGVIIKVVLSDV